MNDLDINGDYDIVDNDDPLLDEEKLLPDGDIQDIIGFSDEHILQAETAVVTENTQTVVSENRILKLRLCENDREVMTQNRVFNFRMQMLI